MITITIDGISIHTEPTKTIIEAAFENGIYIPHFCWHPALGSVGACRQCAVKQYSDENDTRGRLVMSCMTSRPSCQRSAGRSTR